MKKLLAYILLSCMTVSVAQAAAWNVIDISDFSGGLNTRDGAGGVADNELTRSWNTYLLASGIAKRNGYTEYNDSLRIDGAEQGSGIVYAPFSAGGKIVAVAGDSIAYKGTSAWTNCTGSVHITADKQYTWTFILDKLVGVNGTDKPIYWDGTGNCDSLAGTNIPTAPTACVEFRGRLVLAQGNTIYWSEYLNSWTTFHPDDYQQFDGTITGLAISGSGDNERLIIFTRNSITACTFDAYIGASIGGRGVFKFNTISTKHGCISPYSIQECVTDDGNLVLIWADIDGLKALSGTTVIKLTDKIQPNWDSLDESMLDEVIGLHYKTKRWYMLVCSDAGTTHDQVIVYDLRNWCVSGIFDWDISAIGIVPSGNTDQLVGSDYNGYWHLYDSGYNDGGTAIDAYFRTKAYDNKDPLHDKQFASVGLQMAYLGAYPISISAFYDYSEDSYNVTYTPVQRGALLGSLVLGTDRLSSSGGLVTIGNQLKGRGRSVMILVANNVNNQTFQIYKINVPYEEGRIILYQ